MLTKDDSLGNYLKNARFDLDFIISRDNTSTRLSSNHQAHTKSSNYLFLQYNGKLDKAVV